MTSSMVLKRLDPFGNQDLEACAACGNWITWEDEQMVEVGAQNRQVLSFHIVCFESVRAGLNSFAALVLRGRNPGLPN